MGNTKIEWTKKSWNPVTGCTKISPGCQNCYAERMAKRLRGRCGYDADDPFKVTLHPERLDDPLKWRKPTMIFVCSMGDLFHHDVPYEWQANVFNTMAIANLHTYQVLTKRPENMKKFIDKYRQNSVAEGIVSFEKAFRHVWLGVTAENQEMADKRIPILLQIPAAVRFVSVEPMLGPLDLDSYLITGTDQPGSIMRKGLGWVICGGETGPKARPMHPDWARSLKDQCQAVGVSFFLKQMHINGKLVKIPELDGRAWNEMPETQS